VLGKRFLDRLLLDLLKGLLPSLGAGLVIRFSASDWLTYLLWLASALPRFWGICSACF